MAKMRLPTRDKLYWQNQLDEFELYQKEKTDCIAIEFGKQDIRGANSICWIDKKHCIPKQIHFENKWALLGYVQGFNEGVNNECL